MAVLNKKQIYSHKGEAAQAVRVIGKQGTSELVTLPLGFSVNIRVPRLSLASPCVHTIPMS